MLSTKYKLFLPVLICATLITIDLYPMWSKKHLFSKFETIVSHLKNQKRLYTQKKSIFEKIEDFFDHSREKKIHDVFIKTLGNKEFIKDTIKNKGIFKYSQEFINDCLPKKFEEGWEYTPLTPLTFSIKKFGSKNTNTLWFDNDIDQPIKEIFQNKSTAEITEIQSNIVKSLINAGADINKKEYLGKAVEHNYNHFGIHRVKPLLSFPLHDAIDSLNIGAIKTLIENDVLINDSIEQVRKYCGDYSYSYDNYLLHKIHQIKTECIQENNQSDLLIINQIEQMLLKAGARESNESDHKPEWFDDFVNQHTQHNDNYSFSESNHNIHVKEFTSILAIPLESSPKEVRIAFLKKIKEIHPDNFKPNTKEYEKCLELTKKLIHLYDLYKCSIK
ncbi:MAG: hypothetical protein ACOYT8_02035 [Candidatus Dependentiae bacterium]